jgi:hypothetical protein
MCLEFFGQIADVDVTYHAAEQLMEDPRGIIPLPTRTELLHNDNTLVELYEKLDDSNTPIGVAQKMLIRIHNLNEKYDYCYVLAREGFIVSSWASDKGDNHRLTKSLHEYWCPHEIKDKVMFKIEEDQKNFIRS